MIKNFIRDVIKSKTKYLNKEKDQQPRDSFLEEETIF